VSAVELNFVLYQPMAMIPTIFFAIILDILAPIKIDVTTAIALVQSASVLCYRRCPECNAIVYNM